MSYVRMTAITDIPRGIERQCVRHVRGSRVRVYKQDQSVLAAGGARSVWLPNNVRFGPKTDDVEIRGLSRRYGSTDMRNDFMYDPEKEPEAFDAVSVMTMVQRVMNMVRRSLRRNGRTQTLEWFWGRRPIQVWPHAGEMVNAIYQRDDRSILFYFFNDEMRQKTVHTCRSWDIVAHETGHAILDSLQPQWLLDSVDNMQTGGLNESFSDLMAIFGLLEQLDMCEMLITETKGDLSGHSNFLSALGEEFGAACGLPFGIRNAQDDVTMANARYSIHDLSRVFTGAIYDALVKIYEKDSNLYAEDPAETLHRSAKGLLDTFLQAIVESPANQPSFKDVAERMVVIEPDKTHKYLLKEEFDRRYVLSDYKKKAGIVPVQAAQLEATKACSTAPCQKTRTRSPNEPYMCGTLLAARDEAVKADVNRTIHILSASNPTNGTSNDDNSPTDGTRSAIVHVPWHVP